MGSCVHEKSDEIIEAALEFHAVRKVWNEEYTLSNVASFLDVNELGSLLLVNHSAWKAALSEDLWRTMLRKGLGLEFIEEIPPLFYPVPGASWSQQCTRDGLARMVLRLDPIPESYYQIQPALLLFQGFPKDELLNRIFAKAKLFFRGKFIQQDEWDLGPECYAGDMVITEMKYNRFEGYHIYPNFSGGGLDYPAVTKLEGEVFPFVRYYETKILRQHVNSEVLITIQGPSDGGGLLYESKGPLCADFDLNWDQENIFEGTTKFHLETLYKLFKQK